MKVSLEKAAALLSHGEVVAIPTETVYGLAASLKQETAIQKIFSLKGRPQDNPLIVHIADVKSLKVLVSDVPCFFDKAASLWPGPLTIVFPANLKNVPDVVRAGLDTVAVRIPFHPLTLKLIKMTGPLVAPSANLSGSPSATSVKHVEQDFGQNFPVLDGGRAEKGVESTVIRLHGNSWELLREGGYSEERLSEVIGRGPVAIKNQDEKPRSPGMKYRHYSPKCQLILCASQEEIQEKENLARGVLGFSDTQTQLPLFSLGKRNVFSENLYELYHNLRQLDEKQLRVVLVDMDFDKTELGATLANRLEKAAAKL